jgi:hypothetical protein
MTDAVIVTVETVELGRRVGDISATWLNETMVTGVLYGR